MAYFDEDDYEYDEYAAPDLSLWKELSSNNGVPVIVSLAIQGDAKRVATATNLTVFLIAYSFLERNVEMLVTLVLFNFFRQNFQHTFSQSQKFAKIMFIIIIAKGKVDVQRSIRSISHTQTTFQSCLLFTLAQL